MHFWSFENFLKINIRKTSLRAYTVRWPNTHFDRPRVNLSECSKLQGHIMKGIIFF